MLIALVDIIVMDNIVCPITKTQNPFIPNLEVAVQVDGTVMGVGVLLITKTPSRLWEKKGVVVLVGGILIVSIV
jgi:hypothetical protein